MDPNLENTIILCGLIRVCHFYIACSIHIIETIKDIYVLYILLDIRFFPTDFVEHSHFVYEPRHDISNNVVCATSKGSDQPAHRPRLIRAFASRLNIL